MGLSNLRIYVGATRSVSYTHLGSNTDPPALAYYNQTAGNNAPAVGYSTVYPVSMFLRILKMCIRDRG